MAAPGAKRKARVAQPGMQGQAGRALLIEDKREIIKSAQRSNEGIWNLGMAPAPHETRISLRGS